MLQTFVIVFAALFGYGLSVEPSVKCPVPTSPQNGQLFLLRSGSSVKYACNPGFVLLGTDIAHCKDDTWVPEPPTCIREDGELSPEDATDKPILTPPTSGTPRPLFQWGDTDDKPNENSTEEVPEMQNDEARMHMVIYPERRVMTTRARVQSAANLEQEEQRRSGKQKPIRRAPSVLFVRRPVVSGKSSSQIAFPRAAVTESNEKGTQQSDDAMRYMYWLAHHGYPRQAAMLQATGGHPHVMTLSESQLAWINSLHPEVRDRYLKDLYGVRAGEVDEAYRAHAAYLRGYDYPYNYWYYYNTPYYARAPVSVVVDTPEATFDYTCHQADQSGRAHLYRAPKLPNAHVYRYDRRQNPNYPQNHYLAVEYRCNPGFVLLDSRNNELYCSKRDWVGTYPICVPRG